MDGEGRILGADTVAESHLGAEPGRLCRHVVAAQSTDGKSWCHCRCALDLAEGRLRERDGLDLRRDGAPVSVRCSRVGDDRVVVVVEDVADAAGECPLSGRELQVLQAFADGLTTREIGELLGISPGTVRTHTERLRHRLGVHTIAQAVGRAVLAGWLR